MERLAWAYPRDAIIETWKINNRVTTFLLENLPDELWAETVPGAPRRTVRMIAGHLHNCRCMWIKTTGAKHGVSVPKSVDRRRVTPKQLLPALQRSSKGIVRLLELGMDRGGKIPGFPATSSGFSRTSRPTRDTIAGRSRCWHDSSAIVCRPMSRRGCGNGRSAPRSVDSRI